MEKTKAIILKLTQYNDKQKIINVYSENYGYMSFISPNFQSKRTLGTQLMQVTEIEFIRNEKYSLHKIKSINIHINTKDIYFNIYKMNIVMLWAEILNILLKNNEANQELFNYISQSIEYLDRSGEDFANFNLFFLYRLSSILGYRIDYRTYKDNYIFDISNGCFVKESSSPYISGVNAARVIYTLSSCKLDELKNIKLNKHSRSILLDIILNYYSIHFNQNIETKSIKIIRDIFNP